MYIREYFARHESRDNGSAHSSTIQQHAFTLGLARAFVYTNAVCKT